MESTRLLISLYVCAALYCLLVPYVMLNAPLNGELVCVTEEVPFLSAPSTVNCLMENPIRTIKTGMCYYELCHAVYTPPEIPVYPLWLVIALLMFIYIADFFRYQISTHLDNPVGNHKISWYVSVLMAFRSQPQIRPCTLRTLFMKCPSIHNFFASNHTHSDSAKVRNDASSFMDMFSAYTGKTCYMLQNSAADLRNGRVGCRTYHWGKDMTVPYSPYAPLSEDILCIVDVDMYLDMPHLLSTHFQPVLISTFSPSTVSDTVGDFSFTFNEDNEVTYTVSGGAVYNHKVWNYDTDTVVATHCRWNLYHYKVYNVDRRKLDKHHSLVLLTPIAQFTSPMFSLSRWIPINNVSRLCVAQEMPDGTTYLRLSVQTADGLYRSTGIANGYASATILASQDDTIAGQAQIGKNVDLNPATVKMVLGECKQEAAVVLTQYHRQKAGKPCDYVFPVEESVFNYQYNTKNYDPSAKPAIIPFMSPFAEGCYAPQQCKNNDEAMVNGRVVKVKTGKMELSVEEARYMREFSEFLIPEPHVGHPVDIDQVFENQSRPSQRAILNQAAQSSDVSSEDGIKSFMKKEAYGKATDPRGISTYPGVTKLNYSRYTYSFTAVLRLTAWYAFALTPLAIANRVVEICKNAFKICNTDLSRFDGRVSNILRTLEHMLMLRYFAVQYHQELNELMAKQQNQRAKTTFGVKYETGTSRGSGSSETADMNSADNAYMAYKALRRDGKLPKEAWDALGIYGGDDGITADVRPETYVQACADVGQVLEVDEVKRGERGVTFLARYYSPEVWFGANDSMCDVKRQVTKFHTTVSLPSNITPAVKFGEKAYSYYLTDKNTPVMGEIASAYVAAFPERVPEERKEAYSSLHGIGYKHANYKSDAQYPNVNTGGWMDTELLITFPEFDRFKLHEWCQELVASKSERLLLKPNIMVAVQQQHVVKEEVTVNGEVIKPPAVVDISPEGKSPRKTAPVKKERVEYTAEQLQRMSLIPCKGAVEGKCKFGAKCRFKH